MDTEIISTAKNAMGKIGGLVIEHAPMVATGVGVVGVVTTGILAFKAGRKWPLVEARLAEIEEDPDLEGVDATFEKAKAVVPVAAPPILVGCLTIASFIAGQKVSWDRYQVLAATYALTKDSFSEIKDSAKDILGETEAEKLREEISVNRARNTLPDPETEYIPSTGNGKELCCDLNTGLWFRSSAQALRRAQAEVLNQLNAGDAVSLNDLYSWIGLPDTKFGYQMFWYPGDQFDFRIDSGIADDDQTLYYAVSYNVPPLHIRG